MKTPDKNARLLWALVAVAAIMVGVAYAGVPLYRVFCSATGLGGTTQRAVSAPATTLDREVTISFDGNVDPGLPWDFGPDVRSVKVRLGASTIVKFHARNRSQKTTTGTATFNVQPDKAGLYFDKTQCFCFTKQTLKPGQMAEFPVEFFIDPEMAKDHEDDDVQNITLSYTFFPVKDKETIGK